MTPQPIRRGGAGRSRSPRGSAALPNRQTMTQTIPNIPTPFLPTDLTTTRNVDDWPAGRHGKGPAEFRVERDAKGKAERVARRTGRPDGSWNAWKRTVYFERIRIATIDGRTWLFALSPYGRILAIPGTMAHEFHIHGEAGDRVRAALLTSPNPEASDAE